MPVVRVEDGEVYYTLAGPANGPVVLLLHGLGSSADDWAFQMPALAGGHRVLAIDLPGHHRSSRPRVRESISRMAGVVIRVLDALGIEQVHVVGLSLGGCVALSIAVEWPTRVRSLVLVNAFARLPQSGPRPTLRSATRVVLAIAAPMRVLARHVAHELFPRADQAPLRQAAAARLAGNSRRQYLACLGAIAGFDVRGRLGQIGCPTLVVAGSRDTTVAHAAKELLARAITGARLCVVEGSGHVTPCDRPERFNELLLRHLEAAEAPRSSSVDKPKPLTQYSFGRFPIGKKEN